MTDDVFALLGDMERNLDAAIRTSYGGLMEQIDQHGADIWEATDRLVKLENTVAALVRRVNSKETMNG
jgi:arylsulfatase A-like enzyme